METARRAAGVALVIAPLAVAHNAIAQQEFPARPVRIIVPFPPGGSTDPMARMVAARLNERWGESVVVDNRPGGNTIIGYSVVVKAQPDGYTMGWGGPTLMSGPTLIPHLPYDVLKDFVGVATVSKSRNMLVLHPSLSANTLQEVIALAKAKPGQLTYGSSGIGTNVHLNGALFNLVVGVDIRHIPYKGSGPLSTDLLAGRVDLSYQVPITVMAHVQSGKLKPIAISGETRLAALPHVPTYPEAGLPGYYGLTSWAGLVGPAGMPRQVIRKINADVVAMLATPATQAFMTKQGAEPFATTPEEMAQLIKTDVARYGKVIKEANIKFQP
jgi:tripartite-type tricarboxylate transporter receptor subunit TctC